MEWPLNLNDESPLDKMPLEKNKGMLLSAARSGMDQMVARLLTESPDSIDAVDGEGQTALHLAARHGHDKVVAQLLVGLLASPNPMKETRAFLRSARAASRKLIDVVDRFGRTALHLAATHGHEEAVAQLLAASPKALGATDMEGMTALHWAAREGHEEVVAELLAVAKPRSIDRVDSHGMNALHWAARKGRTQIAVLLLAVRPQLAYSIDRRGNSILHFAIESRREELVARLWKMDLDVWYAGNTCSVTPFHLAVKHDCGVELLQWSSSFDEIASAFTAYDKLFLERYRPVMEKQCKSLWGQLHADVVPTVFEYLGFDDVRPTTQNAKKMKTSHSSS